MTSKKIISVLASFCAALAAPGASAAPDAEAQAMQELRNTVVNLLGALVEKGVLTREQAQGMVTQAQQKAATDAAASAAADAADVAAGAIRVPYVPQVVKDEIRKQVAADLEKEVTARVVDQAQSEGWGMPAALPDWISRLRISGDLRLRYQGDVFAEENVRGTYIDFLTVNDRGGIGRAGIAAFANTTEDRQRFRARLRFGAEATLPGGWNAAFRIATGNLRNPVSVNQTLGVTSARYQTGLDHAYLRWSGETDSRLNALTLTGGRLPNPFLTTDLVWDNDVTMEGVAASYRRGFSRSEPDRNTVFATVGAFPMQEVELTRDKWYYGAQLGADLRPGSGHRYRFAVGYYNFRNVAGERNSLDSTLLDYTAPQFLQRGNTLFDIRNDTDPNTNLFALASDFELATATAYLDWRLSDRYHLGLTADYVRNLGYDEEAVQRRTGLALAARNTGYQVEVNFGAAQINQPRAWRASIGYRYLERDATLDQFTGSDMRLGGTDIQGYYFGGEYALSYRTQLRMRYLSGNEIDGAPFGVDILQLDINTQF